MPDALTAARFDLVADGVPVFSELDGIASQVEVVDFVQSATDEFFKKLPRKRTPPTVTLKRGRTVTLKRRRSNDLRLLAWHQSSMLPGGSPVRKSCELTMYNADGKPVARSS